MVEAGGAHNRSRLESFQTRPCAASGLARWLEFPMSGSATWSPEATRVAVTLFVVVVLFYVGYKTLPKMWATALEKGNDGLAGFVAMLFMGLYAV